MSIPAACIRRPVAVAMLVLSVILLGGISFVRLPIDLLPDISYPRLVVYTSYANVAPSEMERLITEPVERESATIPGVERVSSVSRDGLSLVTLRFTWGTDMDFAMLGLREALDNLRSGLPELASRPQILRVDPEAEPILVLSVAGGGDLWRTKELAEAVFKRRLEQLDGVAEAAVAGGLEREIQVEMDARLVEAYGLTLEEISLALAQANVSSPGGTILRGRYRYPLRTLGEIQTVPEIGDVVVGRQRQDGGTGGGAGALPSAPGSNTTAADGSSSGAGEGAFRLVRLRDVATVTDGFAEREATARYNGHESVGLLVFKEAGANTVAVARDVGVVLEQLRVEYPDVTVNVASSQATFISQAISNVVQALVIGGLLAFLVLFLFLRDARYPVAVALSIPISVIATFALLDASGVSMNIMSLGGLALGVGMLVDNSVVVLENIFRHRELGVRGALAAARGAEEVQGAVTAATLTTIAVFAPLIYVRGAAGELFTDLSLAVGFSLLVSIGAALTLLPVLAARWTAEGEEGEAAVGPDSRAVSRAGRTIPEDRAAAGTAPQGRWWRRAVGAVATAVRVPVVSLVTAGAALIRTARGAGRRIARVTGRLVRPIFDGFDGWMKAFASWYGGVLVWALDHRLRVMTLSSVVLAASLALALTLERDMLPNVDQGMFTLRLELPEGTALAATTETAANFEEILLADGDVEAVFTRVGRDPRAATSGDEVAGLHTAVLDVRVNPDASTDDVVERARERGSRSPAATVTFETGRATALGTILGGGEADIAVRVRGEDLDAAFAYAQALEAELTALPMLGNVQLAQEGGQPQIQVEIDRDRAAAYGIEPREIADAIEGSMRGKLATEFVDFDRKIAVIVRLPDDQRYSLETLSELRVRGVPLRGLIQVQAGTGPAEIRREDQGRVVLVYADVISGGLDGAIRAIEERLDAVPPPRGIRAEVGGENEEMRRSFRDLAFAFGLAILLVYMILAAQFESLVQPLIILTAVPMAVVGAVGALALTGEGLNTMSLIGVVILVGIVDNDAVVKVDYINQVRARGVPLREAIIEGSHVRLRPILITTVTTVLGVIPMALGIGAGGELRAPLAIALIGGLTVATALTLVVVPVVYYVAESAGESLRGGSTGYAMATLSLLVLPLGVLAGCGGEAEDSGAIVRDSAGIRIVENRAPVWAPGEEWRLSAEPGVQIGMVEGAPNYQLFRVNGARRLQDGRTVVANGGTQELRFYDPSGRHLLSAGRQGSGPGEFRALTRMDLHPSDSIVVYDSGNRRVSLFDYEGRYARSFALEPPEGRSIPEPVGVLGDGSVLARLNALVGPQDVREGLQRSSSLYARYTLAGGLADTIGSFQGAESYLVTTVSGGRVVRLEVFLLPFGRNPTVAAGIESLYFGGGDSYEIAGYAVDGSLRRLVRLDRPNLPVTPEDIERLTQERLQAVTDAERRASLERRYAEMPYPQFMPAYQRILPDAEENLWVENYRRPGDVVPRWSVFDVGGRFLGDVVMPVGFSAHQIGSDFVLGVWEDELEVEYVQLYELFKPGADNR